MLSRFLKLSYHFAVYAVGICVLLTAVGVTVVRLLLPDIGSYRGEVEAWVSRYMGFPVAIHSLQADWNGWVPNLYLKNIDLMNRQGTGVITHFDAARVSIDPLATLLQQHFVPRHLLISGFRLAVTRRTDGSLYIQGYRVGNQLQNSGDRNQLAEWLFSQNRIEIQQASIEWLDAKHQQKPVLLNRVHLLLRSDQNRIQIQGSAQLPPAYGSEMDFALDARGNLLTSNWSGQLFMEGNNINPDSWYREYRPPGVDIAGGTADIKLWSTWINARLASVQGELHYRDFTALAGKKRLHVTQLSCGFQGELSDKRNWQLRLNLHDLQTENGAWPAARMAVAAKPAAGGSGYRYTAQFSYLKLADLVPFLGDASVLPAGARNMLDKLRPRGDLVNGTLAYRPEQEPGDRIRYDFRFENLATGAVNNLPGLANLSGHTHGGVNGGRFDFSGDSLTVKAPGFKVDNAAITDVDGSMSWRRDTAGLELQIPLLTLSNPDLALRLAGSARFSRGQAPWVDAVAEIAHADLEKLTGYIPYTDKFRMREWMEKAVLGGSLDSAKTLIRGRLSDFPFRDAAGQFELIADVSNGVLEYSPHWPVADNLDTEVVIDKQKLSADINGGKVYNASFQGGTVGIPDLFHKQKEIYVKGKINGENTDLKRFLHNSPLVKNVTIRELHKALSGGGFRLNLDLKVPFHVPDKKPVINGHITLDHAGLVSSVTDMKLTDINGDVAFSRDSVSGKNITARFSGRPVQVAVSGAGETGDNTQATVLTLQGEADNNFIADQIGHYLPRFPLDRGAILDHLSGRTGWTADLRFVKAPDGNRLQRTMTIHSDLQGLAVKMPAPLKKTAADTVALEVSRQLGATAPPVMNISYGDRLSGKITIPRNPPGAAPPAGGGKDNGIVMSGKLDTLPVSQWRDFLSSLKKPEETGSPPYPIHANLDIGSLALLGQEFKDVKLGIGRQKKGWRIDARSRNIAGQIILPQSINKDSLISLDLDRLALQKSGGDGHGPHLNPADLPSIQAKVDDFSYGGRDLGALVLNSTPTDNGMMIDTLTFQKPGLSIRGEGSWTVRNGVDKSSFTIETHAKKIEEMLKTFGYDVTAIKGGETNLLINADWEGSPMDFSLEKLNGHISMHLGEGQLLNVDPSAGRLFGLLSIQALPRRLTLDFSDLFDKGLAFDHIEGNFDITNGNAYTNDLSMKGPSMEIAVNGRTGLSAKDYDQVVTVTPEISSSLPVAGALFGPVGVGVGTVFYLAGEMFGSLKHNIDSLLRYQYTITGSWKHPVIKKIKSEKDKG